MIVVMVAVVVMVALGRPALSARRNPVAQGAHRGLDPLWRGFRNQRLYPSDSLNRLAFIRHARELGFGLEAIRDLLSLSDRPEQSCAAADAIARAQLAEVQRRMASLAALEAELRHMLDQCAQGSIKDCRVIETLGNHALCAHDHGAPA